MTPAYILYDYIDKLYEDSNSLDARERRARERRRQMLKRAFRMRALVVMVSTRSSGSAEVRDRAPEEGPRARRPRVRPRVPQPAGTLARSGQFPPAPARACVAREGDAAG